jgi:hypothetical protein
MKQDADAERKDNLHYEETMIDETTFFNFFSIKPFFLKFDNHREWNVESYMHSHMTLTGGPYERSSPEKRLGLLADILW